MPDAYFFLLKLHSWPYEHYLFWCGQVPGVPQWQLRDVGVVFELSCLCVESKESFVEEDAVGGLLGDQAVGQKVSRRISLRQFGDDLFELAGVGVRPLGTSPWRGLCSFEPLFHCYNNRLQGETTALPHTECTIDLIQSPSPVGLLRCVVVPLLSLPIHVISELLVGSGHFCSIVRSPILLWSIVIVALWFVVVVGLGLWCDGRWRGVDVWFFLLIEVDPVELVLAVEGGRAFVGGIGSDESVVDGVALQFGELQTACVGAVLVGCFEAVQQAVFVCDGQAAVAWVSWGSYF